MEQKDITKKELFLVDGGSSTEMYTKEDLLADTPEMFSDLKIYKITGLVEVEYKTTLTEKEAKKEVKTVAPRKKHKKHNFTKECADCGGKYKGNAGLAIHMGKAHGFSPDLF